MAGRAAKASSGSSMRSHPTPASRINRRALLRGMSALAVAPSSLAARSQEHPTADFRTQASQFIFVEPRPVLPGVVLPQTNGSRLDLGKPTGRPRLMSVWATWCPPCRRELPALEKLSRQAVGKIDVTPVSIDRSPRAAVELFMARLRVSLVSALDPTGALAQPITDGPAPPIALWGMPISYVIDRRGRIAGYLIGEADWSSPEATKFLWSFLDTEP